MSFFLGKEFNTCFVEEGNKTKFKYSAPKKSLSWVAYFSDNCCENGSEADGWRPAGGGAKFNQAQTLFGATVYAYALWEKVREGECNNWTVLISNGYLRSPLHEMALLRITHFCSFKVK